ncbi:chromate transporter [Paraburkholderia pallida]|uniref:Chromate transporter n=1 Tax=Paraburkholderia pallida TaxID=2547399 RepID=A0A4P7D349_9BURK|nr:chromate transporter [Paraburkholderia pallida]
MTDTTPPTHSRPTLLGLFLIFSRIGLTSFGGGLSGWLLREFVQEREWIGEEEFLNGLALSQALPGINVKNMAIWIGHRLLGWRGAAVAVAGVLVPPAIVIVVMGTLIGALIVHPVTKVLIAGAAAAATGLSLSIGVLTARRVRRQWVPLLLMAATFLTIGILRWPLVWVVVIGAALSIGHEYVAIRRSAR